MGVKKLWSILQPVCKKEPLENMRGKTLCVDLSAWICQAEEVFPLKNAVAKPYLRNTIFRVLCLRRLGTQLIFVTEGTPPQLKWDVIVARAKAREEASKQEGRHADKRGKNNKAEASICPPKKVGRSVFQRKINECAQLLRLLGIPVVKSEGEAEACCALLNKEKVADGCITEDGDTFLYGGEVIYKNLGISIKDPHVYTYSLKDIKAELGIGRQEMIVLALLLGCDYTDGVPGIGKQTAIKFLKELCNENILERFKLWSTEGKCSETASSIEKQVFRKTMKVEGFPNEEVIKEFLVPRDEIDKILPQIKWGYPDLVNLQRFCIKHMEWPEEYTLSKVLGVATNEYLHRIPRGIPIDSPLTATRLVKTRIQHGVPLCEVEWKTETSEIADVIWRGYPDIFITLESQQSILKSLPSLVEEFEKMKIAKKKVGKKREKKAPKEAESKDGFGENIRKETKPINLQSKKGLYDDKHSQSDYDDVESLSKERLESKYGLCSSNNAQDSSLDNAVDDVVTSFSSLGIDVSKSKYSLKHVEGKDVCSRKEQKNKKDTMEFCEDRPANVLSLKERLLNRMSSRDPAKTHDLETKIKCIEQSKENIDPSSTVENCVKTVNFSHCQDLSAGETGFSKARNTLVESTSKEAVLKNQHTKECSFDLTSNQGDDSSCKSKTVESISGDSFAYLSPVLKTTKQEAIFQRKVTSVVEKNNTEVNIDDSNLRLGETKQSLSDSLENLLSDSLNSVSLGSERYSDSPADSFDSENYLNTLREKLNIVDFEQSSRSPKPVIEEIEHPCQQIDVQTNAAPLSFMERIKLRSKQLQTKTL